MRRYDFDQGSPEWIRARIGIPTASQFDRIITPKTLKPSSQAPGYINECAAEWLMGAPLEFGSGGGQGYADRGRDMESEARAYYELQHDFAVERVGFITRDDGRVGGSPDALVLDNGGVDFKCPALHTQIGYLINPESLGEKYKAQMQGYLYLTGRDFWDVLAYSPLLPAVEIRLTRDEKFIAALDACLETFLLELDEARRILLPFRSPDLPISDASLIGDLLARSIEQRKAG